MVIALSNADGQADTTRVFVAIRSANRTKKNRKSLVTLWAHDTLHASIYLVVTRGFKYITGNDGFDNLEFFS